jgi:large repetitive protein
LPATTDATGQWTLELSATDLQSLGEDGLTTLSVSATDAAGNVSRITRSITLMSTPPTAPVLSGLTADTDSGRSDSDAITANTLPTLAGRAEGAQWVKVYLGSSLQATVAVSDGQFDFTPAQRLADGVYNYTAVALDAAGNTSEVSGALSITVDTTAPLATSLTGPDVTGQSRPTLTGSAEPDAQVRILGTGLNTEPVVRADADGLFSWQPSVDLADGHYSLMAQVVDRAGNVSSRSEPLALVVDTRAPNAPTLVGFGTVGGTPTALISEVQQQVLQGMAEPGDVVEVWRDGILLGTPTADSTGAFTLDLTDAPLADGTYSFTAVSTDRALNISALASPFDLTVSAMAPPPPPPWVCPLSGPGCWPWSGRSLPGGFRIR